MSSPAKKRKLNNGTKSDGPPTKGLEYFFSKQKQLQTSENDTGHEALKVTEANDESVAAESADTALTDEELARKLQAEWDKELEVERGQRTAELQKVPEQVLSSSSSLSKQSPIPKPEQADPSLPTTTSEDLSKQNGSGNVKTLTLQSAGNAEDSSTSEIPLDTPPIAFKPSEHLDELKKHWESENGDASYALMTRCFVLASATNSRIKIVDTMTNFLRLLIEGDPSSLLPAVSANSHRVESLDPDRTVGLVGNQFNLASLCVSRAWSWGFGNIEGAKTSMRS